MPTSPVAPTAVPTWHLQSAADVLAQLGGTAEGLSAAEAACRLAKLGPNELQEGPRISALRIFLGQFKSFIIWVLIVAGVVSGVLGETVDALAILAIVVLNAVIGFSQEWHAGKSIAALQQLTAPQARVQRDGKVTAVPAAGIVSGDILLLEAGDLVAADARLLSSASLRCIESALTGEAESVSKRPDALPAGEVPLGDRANLVFMGTSVVAGTGRAVVVATAMQTELGRIAGLMAATSAEERTPLERKLETVGRALVWTALGIVALLFGLGLLRGSPPLELFLTSVSLAVAAVPEGLPAVVTVALSLGVLRMARRRALVRQLAAVETLGSTTVIATDKTGTLTRGEMTVRALVVADQTYAVSGEGYGPAGTLAPAIQETDTAAGAPLREFAHVLVGGTQARLVEEAGVWKVIGDPTEGALQSAGRKAGGDPLRLEREWPRHRELPFDSDRKRSTVVRRVAAGRLRAFLNGAPGPVLEQCTHESTAHGVVPLTPAARTRILAQTSALAQQGLRVLGAAWRDLPEAAPDTLTAEVVERNLVFAGLAGMYDPPRPEAGPAVARCRAAGIRVVMITGDHPETALAIARELGLAPDTLTALSGVELENLSDLELRQRAPGISVYARVTAEHKLRIVRAWRANGAIVAMTGDGVNDAPALQGADIGIAMGQAGTEVTKQAADMIITDDNFATIVAAVEEGRGIYDNIRKTLQYLLAGNTGELLLMTGAVLLGLPSPLLPIHLLWINLVTDGLPALCLATDPIDPAVMTRPPRPAAERMTNRSFLWTMLATGLLTAAVALVVYSRALQTGTTEAARGAAFTVLVFAELLRSFGGRSEDKPLWRIPFFTNPSLVIVVALSLALQWASQHFAAFGRFLHAPALPWADWCWLLVWGSVPLVTLEIFKVARARWDRRAEEHAA